MDNKANGTKGLGHVEMMHILKPSAKEKTLAQRLGMAQKKSLDARKHIPITLSIPEWEKDKDNG